MASEAQKQASIRRQFLAQILSSQAVGNTAYNEQGKRPCDADTRVDILADIKRWVYDISEISQSFLWLTGDPGSGKSAITTSVARDCKDAGILWAQFFINRNIGYTTNPASYFPSIARQLADRSPEVALTIHDTLKERPSLMDDISQLQAGKLFVESLQVASSTDRSKPVVVIIDGLDETDPTRLRQTAEIFSQALVDLHGNVKVLISCRTEDDIRKPFSAIFRVTEVKHVHLDTSAASSIRDVSTFLGRNIAKIVERHDLDVLRWPGEERMRGLCHHASGLFIWAVTTIKFIEDQIDMWGRACLDDVLDELNTKGMGDINVLYGTILRVTHRNQTYPWVFEAFRRIVGCIAVIQEPLCLAEIEVLLDIQKTAASRPLDIEHYVRRLRTILVAGTDAIDSQTVPRLHKSFYEYITSHRVDSRFYIETDKSHTEIGTQCLRQLVSLGNRSTSGTFRSVVRYACEFWTAHLHLGILSDAPAGSLSQLTGQNGFPPACIHIALSDDRKRIVSSSGKRLHLWDARNGDLVRSSFASRFDSVLSVAFSPDGNTIISGSSDGTLDLWDAQCGHAIGLPFQGHTHAVSSVAFSPDGHRFISGSLDGTLCLWDTQSRRQIGASFDGHADTVRSVAFSPDGKHIVSGSSDRTIRIWDACSGQPIRSPLNGHTGGVYAVAFSPDGKQIISGSTDKTLRLWDTTNDSGLPLKSFTGHVNAVLSVAFSPDGKQIVSAAGDHTLRLWDTQSHEVTAELRGHTDAVWSVSFSPDGRHIISGSGDGTLRRWDAQSGLPTGLPFKGHTGEVYSIAFSPDGKRIVSGAGDSTLRLWDVASCEPVELPLENHNNLVTSIAISPDGKNIVSGSLDGNICLWDGQTGLPTRLLFLKNMRKIISLAFSPDGSRIAAATSSGAVCLLNPHDQRDFKTYHKEHVNTLTSISFSHDGNQLILVSIDGTTQMWNAITGQSVQPVQPSQSSGSVSPGSNKHCILQQKVYDGDSSKYPRWLVRDNTDFGHWVSFHGKIIRRDRIGLTSIFDHDIHIQRC
jgi:WD40 repeat protein